MNWPTSQDFNEAIQDPSCLSDPDLKSGQVITNAMGLPVPRSGNFADVYQFKGGDGTMWAVKLFTRKVPGLQERYARIDAHLDKAQFPFTVGFQFHQEGIRIKGQHFPLLKMEWVEGFTLNDFVSENVTKPHYLHALVQMWAKLCGRLRDANFAHADLQHGNVLLVPGATPQKLGLKLIDYDGMWVPALAESHSGEVGHPNFQHPLRLKERLYNADVDRFPHLVIAAALRGTLVGGKALWDKFDNADNLLFKEQDLREPGNAPVFKALWNLDDPVLRTLVGHIVLNVKQPLRKTPWLDDVLFEEGGPRLSDEQQKHVCQVLGIQAQTKVAVASAAPPANEEFNVFRFDDDPSPVAVEKKPPASRVAVARKARKAERDQEEAESKGSKKGLLIGGGVGVLALVVVVIALAAGGKSNPTHQEIVQVEKEKEKEKEKELPKPKDKTNPEPAGEGWVSLFNGKDVSDWKGKTDLWTVENGVLVTRIPNEAVRATTSLITTRTDFRDFHVRLEAKINEGGNSGLQFWGIPAIHTAYQAEIMTKAGAMGSLRDAQGRNLQPGNAVVRPDTWFTIEVIARGPKVVIKVDGKDVVDWTDASPPPSPRTGPIGLETGIPGTEFCVRKIDIKEFAPSSPIVPVQVGRAAPGTVVGLAALSSGRDYLFFRQDDKALYQSQGGSSRRGRELGRHDAPIAALAATLDGSRAVTGSQDGIVRVWSLKDTPNAAAPAAAPEGMTRFIASFPKIKYFDDKFGFDVYEEGIVVRDNESGKQESVFVDRPGHPVKGAFKSNLDHADKLAERLGQALTDEVKVLSGNLVVQIFEGGTQIWNPRQNKSWFAHHAKRKGAAAPAATTRPLKEKVSGPTKMGGFAREYEYTVYREGMLIRDIQAGNDARISAGRPVPETTPGFQGNFDYQRLVKIYGVPVSVPTDVFGGTLKVVLCKYGFFLEQTGTTRQFNQSNAKNSPLFTEPDETAGPRELRRFIHGYGKIPSFQGDYGYEAFEEGMRLRVKATNKEAKVPAGRPGGHTVKGPFKTAIETNKRAEKHGEAVTDEVPVFDGALVVQLFQDGAIIWEKASDQTWVAPYTRAKSSPPAPAPAPAAPPMVASAAPKVLKEHTKAIVALAITSDGARALSVGEDELLCEWDLVEGKLIRKIKIPDSLAVAYLPDGKHALLGTRSKSAEIWDLEKQVLEKALAGHVGEVRAVCVSPKGDSAWTAGEDGAVRRWRIPTGDAMGFLSTDKKGISALAVTLDGSILAAAVADGSVRFFEAPTGRISGGHSLQKIGLAMAFVNNGQQLIVAKEPEPLTISVVRPGPAPKNTALTLINESDPLTEFTGRIGFSRDGKLLFHVQKGAIRIVDGATAKELKSIPMEGQVREVAFGSDKQLFVATLDGKFQLWDWEKGEMLKEVDFRQLRQPPVAQIHPTTDPSRLLILTSSPFVMWWDVAEWKMAERFEPFPRSAPMQGCLYPDGSRIALLVNQQGGGRLEVWDLVKKEKAFEVEQSDAKYFFGPDVSPNGKWIVATANENGGTAIVWDAQTGKLVHKLTCVRGVGTRRGFTAGGDHVVFGRGSTGVRVVNVEKDVLVAQGPAQIGSNAEVVYSPGSTLATLDGDRKLRIWHIEIDSKPAAIVGIPEPKDVPAQKGALLHTSEALSGLVTGITYSSDGRRVFASTQTGQVHVLDAANMKEITKFSIGKAAIRGMVLLPKATLLTGANSPERLYLLDEGRHVRVIETDKGTQIRDIDLEKALTNVSGMNYIAVSPREETLFIFDLEKPGAIAWDLKRSAVGKPSILQREPFASGTRSVAFSPDGRVGAALAGGKLLVWNERIGKEIRTIDAPQPGLRLFGFVPDAKAVVAATPTDRLIAWDYESGKELLNVPQPHGSKKFIVPAVMPKGNGIITAGTDRTLRIWDLRSGKEVVKWAMPNDPFSAMVSPDGRFAAVSHAVVNKVSLWAISDAGKKKPGSKE